MSSMPGGFFGPPGNSIFPHPNPFYHEPWNDSYHHAQQQQQLQSSSTTVDWNETPVSHIYKAELPGFKKNDVKVEIEDGKVLCISGEKKIEKEEKTDWWCRVERTSGKFTRRFQIPEDARVDKLTAHMEKDLLLVTIPKKEAIKKETNKHKTKSIHITG